MDGPRLQILVTHNLEPDVPVFIRLFEAAGYKADWTPFQDQQELFATLGLCSWDMVVADQRSYLRGINAELREKVRQLERANAELDHFAWIASHDLKEPLRMIASYTQLLTRRYAKDQDPDVKEFSHYILDGVQRMRALIDGLLAYSRLISQPGDVRVAADSSAAVHEALLLLKAAAEESNAQIQVDPLPRVCIEPAALVQVFQNLLANALKYGKNNQPPVIRISAVETGDEARFAVADNGLGIEPEYFHRIFELFRRLHGNEYPGLGIGLAMCKRIIEHHGGRIWLESQPGVGSTFYFTLRLASKASTVANS
jgi:light-regulated signal transduction histidine kinase (bacteriophytochrome)